MDAVTFEENPIQGPGTPLAAWRHSGAVARTPWIEALTLRNNFERLVVVAPHPDDEILGCSALLRAMAGDEARLVMIAVTDGEASHPESLEWTPEALRRQRPEESRLALDRLGLDSERVVWHRLGLPDSAAASRIDRLEQHLRAVLQPGDAVLTTWRHDGHCDHDATGQACARVASERGLPLIEVPVWAWHWADPEDERLPWAHARKIALDPPTLQSKHAAIAAHVTQLTPQGTQPAVLTEATLQRLLQPFELVFLSRCSHDGE
ncbi:PIG-L family deacetylase [Pseudomonas sp. GD03842]|uniref:PIG-L deacetylase family protein n=1 Tax=Pseudomonas sp. GD03842 TaxID=2975385 RepID=UPI00244CE7AA|nr:PIG-L family deacetylase [Pseudomonas sp. GD03842]MDH0748837.1 PIG-L family deacetylase [Pseudomonas sp. GD03842]